MSPERNQRPGLCGLFRLFILLALAGAVLPAQTQRPNFIVIFADDLGYGDLSSYGSKTIRTPVLDRMAAEGMRFTDFYSTAPFCSPSRSSMLTGRYPARAGVPYVLFPTEDIGLPQEEITIAELLSEAGYATACIGKWHLGTPARFRAHRHGFDFFYGLPYSNDMFKYPGEGKRRAQHADVAIPLMWNDETLEAPVNQHTLTMRYTDRAVRFIRENKDRPFFLYLPHTFPHTPSYASKEFEGRSPHGLYADSVEELDHSTGVILETLKELDLDEKTLVIFASDNGPTRGAVDENGKLRRERWGGGDPGPLRGRKGTTWEGGMRVPGIFRWPGRIPAGVTTGEVASTADVLPTLAELAGVNLPDRTLDGRSIAPVLTGAADTVGERLFCYYFGVQLQAVRLGRWKLLVRVEEYPEGVDSLWYRTNPALFERQHRLLEKPELYDLLEDIGESRDLSGERADIVERLTEMAREFDRSLQADIH